MTHEEWAARLPLIQAFVDGKRVQFYSDQSGWKDAYNVSFTDPVNNYRIAPEPKLRPWTAEEVPVGAVLRYKNNKWSVLRYKNNKWSCRFLITASTEIHMVGYGTRWRYHELLEQMEYSKDGFTNWLPCGVVEGEK